MTQNLEQWFNELIVRFKEEYKKLSETKMGNLASFDKLNDLCLIESIWIRNEVMDSNLQFHFFFIHPKKELNINCEKIDNLNYLDRLNEIVYEIHSKAYLAVKHAPKDSEKEYFNNLVAIFLNGVKFFDDNNRLLQISGKKIPPKIVSKSLVSPNCFCWISVGIINDIEIETIVNEIISNAISDSLIQETPAPVNTDLIEGYGTFFYPPIWIGKFPKFSFNKSLRQFTKKVMVGEYKDNILIFRNDGFVAVSEKDEKKALNILNEIMAAAAFLDIPSSIVRESERVKVTISKEHKEIASESVNITSMRTLLISDLDSMPLDMEIRRINIKEEKIIELVSSLKLFSDDEDYKNFMIFYLESISFFRTGLYSQSFLMSWLVIERYLSFLWKKEVIDELKNKNNMPKFRKNKLKNRYADYIIETMNLMKIIKYNDYEMLMELKHRRNLIVHKGQESSEDEARKCLDFAQKVLKGIKSDNHQKIVLKLLELTLTNNKVDFKKIIGNFGQVEAAEKREKGYKYAFNEHLKALIYSMLSNRRKWADVVDKLPQIDAIFLNFDADKLENCDTQAMIDKIREVKCGNISIYKQIDALPHNIRQLKKIETEFGSLDTFVTHKSLEEIVKLLSDGKSEYKIKQMGDALALEYLKSVGIRGMKPDVHILRICGPERLDIITAKDTQTQLGEFKKFAKSVNVHETYLDNLIWIFGAKGYGEICTKNPKCSRCELTSYCNYNNGNGD